MQRDVVCDMLSCVRPDVDYDSMLTAVLCRLEFDVVCDSMSSVICYHLRFDVVRGHLKWRLGLGHDLVFSEHETTCDLV